MGSFCGYSDFSIMILIINLYIPIIIKSWFINRSSSCLINKNWLIEFFHSIKCPISRFINNRKRISPCCPRFPARSASPIINCNSE